MRLSKTIMRYEVEMNPKWVARGLLVGSLLVTGPAFAQDDVVPDAENPGVVYKKETVYDFEEDIVEGSFVRPEGEYLDSRRAARHSSLIKIRESFVPEMLKSAEDL
jgi:hypothetical protein